MFPFSGLKDTFVSGDILAASDVVIIFYFHCEEF